jgi:hypothetical protein
MAPLARCGQLGITIQVRLLRICNGLRLLDVYQGKRLFVPVVCFHSAIRHEKE